MAGFLDELTIEISSGGGGAGCVSFRREKYIPRGGPDGGDGGRGGDVVFRVKRNLKTLTHLRRGKLYAAGNGRPGSGGRKNGINGDDAVLELPPGSIIRDCSDNAALCDFDRDGEGEFVLLRGGNGGKGNYHFRGSRNQAPRYAQPGLPGKRMEILIELRLIADVGLVGMPSSGKSSLQRNLTNSQPRVAPYPFTTKIPNLGVFRIFDRDIVIADIPGLIVGAADGAGLGNRFLKHISRVSALFLLVDMSCADPHGDYSALARELERYDSRLLQRRKVVVATKIDLPESVLNLELFLEKMDGVCEVIPLSNATGEGIDRLKTRLTEVADG